MDDQLLEHIARNEAAFRAVNERLRHSGDAVASVDKLFAFTCECGRLGCNRLIEMTRPEYEQVRADPRTFAVVDGHEIPEAEVVIRREARYTTLRKRDEAAPIVTALDPRT